jgi:hypothetical protein
MMISLCNNTDWEGRLVTDALAKMKTKKDISMDIFGLPKNVRFSVFCFFFGSQTNSYQYMLSLRAKNKKKTPTTTKHKGGKAKLTVIDLDNNDSEEGEDNDDEGVGAAEKKALSELELNSKPG